jgi:hypothetical protein
VEDFMTPAIQVGAILVKEWPMQELLAVESDAFTGNWGLVKLPDGFALDRKIRALGWNFFFIATEAKAMFFGAIGSVKMREALKRLLGKEKQQSFNCLEVTGIAAKRFLGAPYVVVSAHSRHVQRSCYLDSAEARRAAQSDAEWAKS